MHMRHASTRCSHTRGSAMPNMDRIKTSCTWQTPRASSDDCTCWPQPGLSLAGGHGDVDGLRLVRPSPHVSCVSFGIGRFKPMSAKSRCVIAFSGGSHTCSTLNISNNCVGMVRAFEGGLSFFGSRLTFGSTNRSRC